jgi:transposase
MEACSGAHHWARLFTARGHTVRLIAPKFVTPYRMSGARGKTDAADAAAICEAVQRPAMRFVPMKSLEQQSQLMVHRARQGFVETRTACINRIRGLLSEFGQVLPLKADTAAGKPARCSRSARLGQHRDWRPLSELHRLDERIAAYDDTSRRSGARTRVKRLMRLGGTVPPRPRVVAGDRQRPRVFAAGSSWHGWTTPGQYSSGGKTLGRITKAGDAYGVPC